MIKSWEKRKTEVLESIGKPMFWGKSEFLKAKADVKLEISKLQRRVEAKVRFIIAMEDAAKVLGDEMVGTFYKENRLLFDRPLRDGEFSCGELQMGSIDAVKQLEEMLKISEMEIDFNIHKENLREFDFARLERIPNIYHSAILVRLIDEGMPEIAFEHFEEFSNAGTDMLLEIVSSNVETSKKFAEYFWTNGENNSPLAQEILHLMSQPW